MKFTIQFNLLRFGIIVALLFATSLKSVGQRSAPVHKPENKVALENHDSRAQSYVLKNLNRFGLDKLKDYDKALSESFSYELKDTLELMEKTYMNSSSSVQKSLVDKKGTIAELTSQKSELSERYSKLLRTAAFAFGVWLLLIIVFLQFQKRKIKKKNEELEITTAQLKHNKEKESLAKAAIDKVRHLKNSINKLSEDTMQLNDLSKTFDENNSVESKWTTEISSSVQRVSTAAQLERRLANAFISQEGEISSEKESTNINMLCEEYLTIASRGLMAAGNEINCNITNDFEKNLPMIKINQAAIGSLLLNVLNNAFQSVEDKFNKGVKGYQPKVSISTRILPRFLQIRIRDNGTGMIDSVLQNATTPFFTTRQNGKGAGLGLSDSQKIMTEFHKGEIKIESENGNSTDVYIKFFL
jgi:signal transduction histidine kinase